MTKKVPIHFSVYICIYVMRCKDKEEQTKRKDGKKGT